MNTKKISAVPTTVITGFLGAGKSSAILHLLNHKPGHERWAVLVNEFGEIGVDGSLIQGQHSQTEQVFIREVPGGCMCCTAGLPMQVALNQLLKTARPDRLLIEPTGLGHPKEVLQSLTTKAYSDIIALQKIITLVDARKLSDARYTEHPTFNEQIAIADIVVGNKKDLYQAKDADNLTAYVKRNGSAHAQVVFSHQGDITTLNLTGSTAAIAPHHHHHADDNKSLLSDMPIPACGFIKAINQGEGFFSIGWRFSSDTLFRYKALYQFLISINAERMKAVLITDKGVFAYNQTTDALTETELLESIESRIEIIAANIDTRWEERLMNCIGSKE